jgi:hypothetical protein
MTLRTTALLVAWSLSASSAYCFAQELESVQDARRRSEEFVANARNQTVDPQVSDKEDAEAADQRAMNDPSLQPGDIIATSRGFRIFVGRDHEEHQPGDFLPAPNPRDPR